MSQPPPPPTSCPLRFVPWLAAVLTAGWGLGILAAIVQQRFAPLILFPLLFGAIIGATAVFLARIVKLGHRRAVGFGAIAAVLLAVFAMHWQSYRLAVAQALRDAEQHAQLVQFHPQFATTTVPPPPEDVWQFLSERAEQGRLLPGGMLLKHSSVWGMWGFETLLTITGALAVVIPLMRHPYCDRCRSWFRMVRRGELSRRAGEWVASRQQFPAEHLPLEYRLLACESGCGASGLDVSWPVTRGAQGVVPAGGVRLWLSKDDCRILLALLDEDAQHAASPIPDTSTDRTSSGARSEPPKHS